jgi:hypothetical protein
MRFAVALGFAAVIAVSTLAPSTSTAQDKLEVRKADTVKSLLERQVGKRVGLVLTTGPELTGIVADVGDQVVHLSQLGGREFFDAVVSLDRISAVVVRARGQ